MPRRSRKNESPLFDGLIEILQAAPWWGGPILTALVFGLFAYIVPAVLGKEIPGNQLSVLVSKLALTTAPNIAPFAAGIVFMLWGFVEFQKWIDRRRLDAQSGVDSIRQLRWDEFERLLGEAFRRGGYHVEQVGGNGPDGGVDLRLKHAGAVTLVQCKHWKNAKVGVKVAREFYGVVNYEGAQGGIIVSSGHFTQEAEDFARGAGIRLIGREELLCLIQAAQRSQDLATNRFEQVNAPAAISPFQPVAPLPSPPAASSPGCPRCGATMIVRKAKRGPNAGATFWGCPNFPRCNGTRPELG